MTYSKILSCVSINSRSKLQAHLSNEKYLNTAAWNKALHWCAKNNENIGGMYQKMKQEGVKPTVVTLNILIAGYKNRGENDVAYQLFDYMKRDWIRPNDRTISSLLKNSSMEEMEKIIKKHSLNAIQAGLCLKNCSSLSEMKTIVSWIDHCETPTDVIFWSQFIVRSSELLSKDSIKYVLDQLSSRGMIPTEAFISAALLYSLKICKSQKLSQSELDIAIQQSTEIYNLLPHNSMKLHEQQMFVFAAAGCCLRADLFNDEVLDARGNIKTPAFSRAYSLVRTAENSRQLRVTSFHNRSDGIRSSTDSFQRRESSQRVAYGMNYSNDIATADGSQITPLVCNCTGEPLKVFCYDDRRAICLVCSSQEHKGHKTELLRDFCAKERKKLETKKVHVDTLLHELTSLYEEAPRKASKLHMQVDTAVTDIISVLNARRKVLHSDIRRRNSTLIKMLESELTTRKQSLQKLESVSLILRLLSAGCGVAPEGSIGDLLRGSVTYDDFLSLNDPDMSPAPNIQQLLKLNLPLKMRDEVLRFDWTSETRDVRPLVYPPKGF